MKAEWWTTEYTWICLMYTKVEAQQTHQSATMKFYDLLIDWTFSAQLSAPWPILMSEHVKYSTFSSRSHKYLRGSKRWRSILKRFYNIVLTPLSFEPNDTSMDVSCQPVVMVLVHEGPLYDQHWQLSIISQADFREVFATFTGPTSGLDVPNEFQDTPCEGTLLERCGCSSNTPFEGLLVFVVVRTVLCFRY